LVKIDQKYFLITSLFFQLNEEKCVNASSFSSPLATVLERYANFEKTIGHMLAVNEMELAKWATFSIFSSRQSGVPSYPVSVCNLGT
jgi:hypothetical protein